MKVIKTTLAIIIMLTLISTVSAIGIAPAKYSVYFEPKESLTYSYWIVNKEKDNITIDISVEGNLSKHITLLNRSIDLKDTDEFKRAFFRIDYPFSLGTPGPHLAEFIFKEKKETKETRSGESQIEIIPSLVAQFESFVPYTGRYLESGLQIESSDGGQPIAITMPLANKGTENIESIYIDIKIFEEENLISDYQTESISLKSKQSTDIRYYIGSLEIGTYKADIKLNYNDKIKEIKREFDYGAWIISIKDVRIEKLSFGDFSDVNITLYNNWNKDAEDVYAKLIISNLEGYKYETITTYNTIPKNDTSEFTSYWETPEELPDGRYFFTIKIFYDNKTKQYIEETKLEDKRLITKYYDAPIPVSDKLISKEYIVVIKSWLIPIGLVIMLAAIVTALIFTLYNITEFISKKKEKKKKKVIIKEKRKIMPKVSTTFHKLLTFIKYIPFVENIRKKIRIRNLQKEKEKNLKAIKEAKYDLIALKTAIKGLYSELKKGVISKKEFNKRIDLLLKNKNERYWEDYYTKLIIELEEKNKKIIDKIWKE